MIQPKVAFNLSANLICYSLRLLPPKQISYNLRSRGYGLTLSAIPSEFMRKNFLYRMLYNDIY